MLFKKKSRLLFVMAAIGVCLSQSSCSSKEQTNKSIAENCLDGLPDSQRVMLCNLADLLKDTSKISDATFGQFGLDGKKEAKDFSNSGTVSQYILNSLSGIFRPFDLTEITVADADALYANYVTDKAGWLEQTRITQSGRETKSMLVSTDSLYKLVNALYQYQQMTSRKTGIRFVMANGPNTGGGTPVYSPLTFFLVGTMDTTVVPAMSFDWNRQKDLTILAPQQWSIPAWGQLAYNHGELCPNHCGAAGENTRYHQ